MILIGQKKNWKILSDLIKNYHLDNSNTFNVFFYKNHMNHCTYLAKKFVNDLGIEYIVIDCNIVKSIGIFKMKLNNIAYKSIIVLKNYDRARANIKKYFENFINKKYTNKNISRIVKSLIIITTNTKKTISKIKGIDIFMEKYTFDELIKIANLIIDDNGYDRDRINIYSLIKRNNHGQMSPKYLERLLQLHGRYEVLVKLTKTEDLNFYNFDKTYLLIWNMLTILDLNYLLMIHFKTLGEEHYFYINSFYKDKKIEKFILNYLSLNHFITWNKDSSKLTLKGEKVINSVLKSETIISQLNRLDFQIEENTNEAFNS